MGWNLECDPGTSASPSAVDCADDGFWRIATASRRKENTSGAPGSWIGQPLSNTRGIRGSRGRDIPIERRWGDSKALRDLSDGDVRIGEHRLGSLDVIPG